MMFNKKRMVRIAKFSSLSFSLVSGLSMAQQQLPSQLVSGNNAAAASSNVNTVAPTDVVTTQPVVVTPSMAPVQAPVADSVSGIRANAAGVSVSSTPSTGIGGANTGNANTGGLQVQNVTVQANPDATSSSAVNTTEYPGAELARQRRIRREVENETRLLQRLEEGRMADERVREGSIEQYQSAVAGSASATAAAGNNVAVATAVATPATTDLVTVPVAQTGSVAMAPASVGSSTMTTQGQFLGMHSFTLAPFVGYRWFNNNNYTAYRAQNMVTTGLMLDGKINQYLSFEGSFTYGHDRFYMNQMAYGYYGSSFNAGESRDTFEVAGGLRVSKTFNNSFTPYIAGSLGGMLSKYNIDNPMVLQQLSVAGLARTTTQFIGNIGFGMDYRLAQNFSIGGRFDYQASLNNYNNYMYAYNQNSLNSIWNDTANRYRLTGSIQLVF